MKPNKNTQKVIAKYQESEIARNKNQLPLHHDNTYQLQLKQIEEKEIEIVYNLIRETQGFWRRKSSWYTHHVSRRVDQLLGRSKVRYPKFSDLLSQESAMMGKGNSTLGTLVRKMDNNMRYLNKSQMTVVKKLKGAYKTAVESGETYDHKTGELLVLKELLVNHQEYDDITVVNAIEAKCKLTGETLFAADRFFRAEAQKDLYHKQIKFLDKLQVAQFMINLSVKQRFDLYTEIKRSADNLVKVLDVLPHTYDTVQELENRKSRVDHMLRQYSRVMDARENLESDNVGHGRTNKLREAIVYD